jgi:hypothetical protein
VKTPQRIKSSKLRVITPGSVLAFKAENSLLETNMNESTHVTAPSNAIAPGTSHSEPSLNPWSFAAIEQVLLHFPGNDVIISKGGETQLHMYALPDHSDEPYASDYQWMCRFYSARPGICEGDDLGTTAGCVAAVLLAAMLTDIRLPGMLAEMTSLPVKFVEAVLDQTDAHDLWNAGSLIHLNETLLNHREDFAAVESALNWVVEEYWDVFYSSQKVAALMTLRERRLFGGKVQHWTDADAMDVFGL